MQTQVTSGEGSNFPGGRIGEPPIAEQWPSGEGGKDISLKVPLRTCAPAHRKKVSKGLPRLPRLPREGTALDCGWEGRPILGSYTLNDL